MVASITAVIGTTGVVIRYMSDVKDAPKEKLAFANEAEILMDLILRRRNLAEEAKKKNEDSSWYRAIQKLGDKGGPLELFKEALEALVTKLKPSCILIKGAARPLRWPFDKADVVNALTKMERLKSHIQIALSEDQL